MAKDFVRSMSFFEDYFAASLPTCKNTNNNTSASEIASAYLTRGFLMGDGVGRGYLSCYAILGIRH